MGKTHTPLIDALLEDTIENCRNVLAVIASATADPELAWDRTGPGVNLLLAMVDTALAEAAKVRQPWAVSDPAPGGEG